MGYMPPDYRLPEYGLNGLQLRQINTILKLPRWERRKLHRRMGGGPRTAFIYRYMPFNHEDSFSLKKIRDVIVDSKLYLSPPSGFNDPYEFRAFLALEDDPVLRRKNFEKTARRLLKRGMDTAPEVRGRNRKIEAMTKKAMEGALTHPGSTMEAFERAKESNGVVCFSEDPRGLLLWSYYAAGHTGICLQFDITMDPGILMLTHRVNYEDKLAHLVWPREEDQVVDKVILQKSSAWKHEREVRYVSIHVVGNFLKFDARALRAVILGARFSSNFVSEFRDIVADRAKQGLPSLAIYQAHQRDREYALYLSRINGIDELSPPRDAPKHA